MFNLGKLNNHEDSKNNNQQETVKHALSLIRSYEVLLRKLNPRRSVIFPRNASAKRNYASRRQVAPIHRFQIFFLIAEPDFHLDIIVRYISGITWSDGRLGFKLNAFASISKIEIRDATFPHTFSIEKRV